MVRFSITAQNFECNVHSRIGGIREGRATPAYADEGSGVGKGRQMSSHFYTSDTTQSTVYLCMLFYFYKKPSET